MPNIDPSDDAADASEKTGPVYHGPLAFHFGPEPYRDERGRIVCAKCKQHVAQFVLRSDHRCNCHACAWPQGPMFEPLPADHTTIQEYTWRSDYFCASCAQAEVDDHDIFKLKFEGKIPQDQPTAILRRDDEQSADNQD